MTTIGSEHPPIAIVGLSALFPSSHNADLFWQNIVEGRDLIKEVPPTHWLSDDYFDPDPGEADKTYCKRGGFLPDIAFDPVEFGIPPTNIPATDTTQLLALVAAKRVLEDAFDADFATMDKERMSIVLGVTAGQELLIQAASRLQRPQWLAALRDYGIAEDKAQEICDRIADQYTPWQESTFPGLLGNVVAGRIANRFDLGGTNCITDAACASSLSAMSMALNELYLGHSDAVITGGVDCFNDIFMYMCFTKTPALSRAGDCRPFDQGADGTLMGEGLGLFALKRLDDAEADDDAIYAVIRGLGSSSDGRSLSVYAPLAEGQAKALRRAQDRAGVDPSTIELVEAHGTATNAGDVAEFEGLRRAFSDDPDADDPSFSNTSWCALGSIKSQIGHTKAAAGAASLFKTAMALHHRLLPPTAKVDAPADNLNIENSPFYLNTQARPWIRGNDHPRRAGVSSFGFGGSNFHVVLEEYRGDGQRPPRRRTLPTELFTWAADSADALIDQISDLLQELPDDVSPADEPSLHRFLAHQSQQAFDPTKSHRLALVATDLTTLQKRLNTALNQLDAAPSDPFDHPDGIHFSTGASPASIAFLFPGQGSQYVHMGADLAMHFDVVADVWDQIADQPFDLATRVFPPPAFTDEARQRQAQELTATQWAQPAIGADSAARLALLNELGVNADAVGGHSFGEITALYAAGVLDDDTFLPVARRRGELMADAASETSGAMTAVRSDADTLNDLLSDHPEVVIANDNSPRQVVISGPTDAIAAAEEELEEQWMAFQRLPVDTAFHSPVVADATEPFAQFLDDQSLGAPELSVFANATASPYDDSPDAIRQTLTSQIESSVQFCDMVQNMAQSGVDLFIEVGPGQVLSRLADQILADLDTPPRALSIDQKGNNDAAALFQALAQLSAMGVKLNFEALWQGYATPQDPRKRDVSPFTVPLNGANVGRPYPPENGVEGRPEPNAVTTGPIAEDLTHAHARNQTQAAEANDAAPNAPTQRDSASPSPTSTSPDPMPHRTSSSASTLPTSDTSSPSTPGDSMSDAQHPTNAQAFREYQRSLADTHRAYLEMMERSVSQAQMAYMQAMERAFTQWQGTPENQPHVAPSVRHDAQNSPIPQHPTPPPPSSFTPTQPAAQPSSPQPSPTPAPRPPKPATASPSPTEHTNGATRPATPAPTPSPVATAQTASPAEPPRKATSESVDIADLFLEVVADKTGYPSDMLDNSMALEADLGIDSIKRVEILSAVQDQAPSLPDLDPNDMASLKTLGEIVGFLQSSETTGGTPREATPAVASSPSSTDIDNGHDSQSTTTTNAGGISLDEVFLEVVADKTGYPSDMLDNSMALEADLGIDSIKRVEILSAVQDQVPSLPDLDPNNMASLKTLGEIVDFLEDAGGGPPPNESSPQGGERLGKPKAATRPARWVPGLVAATPTGTNLLLPSPIAIIDDGTGIGDALQQRLDDIGYSVTRVSSLDELDAPPGQLIDLQGLGSVSSIDEALAIQRRAFQHARAVADDPETFVVAFDGGGYLGHPSCPAPTEAQAYLGGLTALAKTAHLEWPKAHCRAIDIATDGRSPEQTASLLIDELIHGGHQIEVGIAPDGTRQTLASAPAPLEDTDPIDAPIGPDDIIVATGGARGVTAHCLIELARRHQPTIILLGRTTLDDEPAHTQHATTDAEIKRALIEAAKARGDAPDLATIGRQARTILKQREIRTTLQGLEDAGSTATYLSADVRDRRALNEAFDTVRQRFGAPTALVHAAGVLADRRIADKDDDQFDFVFQTKVDGLRALREVSADDPITTLALFSSVAGRTGNIGQVDYAMANETLNKIGGFLGSCRTEGATSPASGLDIRSFAWGPWDGGMVEDSLRAHFQSQGISLIDLGGGARAFVDEWQAADAPVEVVYGDGLIDDQRPVRLRRSYDAIAHPELSGHTIEDTPVLPVAYAAFEALSLAQSLHDDPAPQLFDLRMQNGIVLDEFHTPGASTNHHWLAQPTSKGFALSLRDTDQSHYQTHAQPAAPPTPISAPSGLDVAPWVPQEAYEHYLFHSDDFEVLTDLRGLQADHASATIAPTSTPIALDAGLQLAVLQGIATEGRANLPTKIGTFYLAPDFRADQPLHLRLHTQSSTPHRITVDIDWLDDTMTRQASMRDVELYFRGDPLL